MTQPIDLGKHFDGVDTVVTVHDGSFTIAQFKTVIEALHGLMDYADFVEYQDKPYSVTAKAVLSALVSEGDLKTVLSNHQNLMRDYNYRLNSIFEDNIPEDLKQKALRFDNVIEALLPGASIGFKEEKIWFIPLSWQGDVMTEEQKLALSRHQWIINKVLKIDDKGFAYFDNDAVADINPVVLRQCLEAMDKRATHEVAPRYVA